MIAYGQMSMIVKISVDEYRMNQILLKKTGMGHPQSNGKILVNNKVYFAIRVVLTNKV